MDDTAILYEQFKARVLEYATYSKLSVIQRSNNFCAEYVFGAKTVEDALYYEVVHAIEHKAKQEVEWLLRALCAYHKYPVDGYDEQKIISDDILFIKGDQIIQANVFSFAYSNQTAISNNQAPKPKHRKPPIRTKVIAETYTIYLFKRTPAGYAWLERNAKANENKKAVLLADFIEEIFGKKEADAFERAMARFPEEMNEELGNHITRIGNERVLERLRDELVGGLLDFDYSRVKKINDEENSRKAYIGESSFKITRQRFEFNYKVLLGRKDFVSSFLTSEWLYWQQSRVRGADYTYIVAGYLKSVEQLLWEILLLVRKGKYIGPTNSIIGDEDIQTHDTTLGALSQHIENSDDSIFNKAFANETADVRTHFVFYLNRWIHNTRNGFFHKHLLTADRLRDIREQTYYLYFLILGTLSLTNEQVAQLAGETKDM